MGGDVSNVSIPNTVNLSVEKLEMLRSQFDKADSLEKNNLLDPKEFSNFINMDFPQLIPFTRAIISMFGVDNNINFEQFAYFIESIQVMEKNEDDPNSLPMLLFKKFDSDGNKNISAEEIQFLGNLMGETNTPMSLEEANALVAKFAADPDQGLTPGEFIRLFNTYLQFDPMKTPRLLGAGENISNQLFTQDQYVLHPKALPIDAEKLVSIGAGEDHSVFVYANGSAFAIGNNSDSQIGGCPMKVLSSITQVKIEDYRFQSVYCGGTSYTIYLTDQGVIVICSSQSPDCPIIPVISKPAVYVTGSLTKPYAIDNEGAVIIFHHDHQVMPVRVTLPVPIYHLAAGSNFTIAVGTDGTVYGDKVLNMNKNEYEKITTLENEKIKYACIYNDHAVLLTQSGTPLTYGNNSFLQLGRDSEMYVFKAPNYHFISAVLNADSGDQHTIFVTAKGKLVCSGANQFGQLCLGHNRKVLKPMRSTCLHNKASSVICGKSFTYILVDAPPLIHTGAKFFNIKI